MKKIKGYLIELSLVIAGILIAFAIENWGKRIDNRDSLRSYLEQIETDLQNDITRLNRAVIRDSMLTQKLGVLFKLAQQKNYQGIDTLFGTMISYSSFRVTTTGYQMLVNSDLGNLLPIVLYSKITTYYNVHQDFYREQYQMDINFAMDNIVPYYIAHFRSIEQDAKQPNFNHSAFSGYIFAKSASLRQVYNNHKTLRKRALELKEVIHDAYFKE